MGSLCGRPKIHQIEINNVDFIKNNIRLYNECILVTNYHYIDKLNTLRTSNIYTPDKSSIHSIRL
jgi:hypothetical protein